MKYSEAKNLKQGDKVICIENGIDLTCGKFYEINKRNHYIRDDGGDYRNLYLLYKKFKKLNPEEEFADILKEFEL